MGIDRALFRTLMARLAPSAPSFASVFRIGLRLGIPTYRRTDMLRDWRELRGATLATDYLTGLRSDVLPDPQQLSLTAAWQRQEYRWQFRMRGTNTITDEPIDIWRTLETDELHTRSELESIAMDTWGEGRYEANPEYSFTSARLMVGFRNSP